jgi:hypothetical protein
MGDDSGPGQRHSTSGPRAQTQITLMGAITWAETGRGVGKVRRDERCAFSQAGVWAHESCAMNQYGIMGHESWPMIPYSRRLPTRHPASPSRAAWTMPRAHGTRTMPRADMVSGACRGEGGDSTRERGGFARVVPGGQGIRVQAGGGDADALKDGRWVVAHTWDPQACTPAGRSPNCRWPGLLPRSRPGVDHWSPVVVLECEKREAK